MKIVRSRPPWLPCAALVLAAATAAAAELPERIDNLLAQSPAAQTAFWGIQIVDLASGATLYDRNSSHFFVPASNTKLFTTAMALARLGPNFRFYTRVLAEQPPDAEGRIRGPLRLVGGGDPNLSARILPYQPGPSTGNPLAAIEDLAGQIAARGVKRIEGSIIGDDTWYVWEPYAEGWAIDDPQYGYGAPVSALTLNDNTLTLTVHPGARPGMLAALQLDPPIEYYQIDNRVLTTAARGASKVEMNRLPGSRQLRLWGTLPMNRTETMQVAVDDPAEFAAMALRRALEERGITVTGGIAVAHEYPNQEQDLTQRPEAPAPTGYELARRTSGPLIEDLQVTDKVSQNLHAELALRAVARERRHIGSIEAGLAELQLFLDEAGIPKEAYSLHDGSGLSRLNLVTPAAVVGLLRYMYRSPFREDWISLLPVGNQDGTLTTRLNGAAAGLIHAKTGSLSHVSALSGYAVRPDGTWLAFSILVNNHDGPNGEVRGVIDRICSLMVE
ncbi:MAG TPA: D-alanyl-D-alanine carboxypeptidase/D-alanyl-D-alanine-endopeptidase [Bryobacteraceae bacterium]|nr:D-alanyl-D-alanine carboxypeptidase/D-alanyl-D-alanine-endopeptidase [Bryobacteraceae bacterium]